MDQIFTMDKETFKQHASGKLFIARFGVFIEYKPLNMSVCIVIVTVNS